MTRAELEQVRAWVERGVRLECGENDDCDACMSGGVTLAMIDAELSRPEAREWRVTAIGNLTGNRLTPEPVASLEAAKQYAEELSSFRCVIEYRTPAGPWEPLGVKS